MAEFTGDLHSLILEPSCSAVKSNIQLIDDLISHRFMDLSSDHHHQQPQFSLNFTNDIQSSAFNLGPPAPVLQQSLTTPFSEELKHENKKEKNSSGRKRKRDNDQTEEMEKPSEVIHVRVKRGQATDSHSLAERVRRQKINERLKSLQNLVPGCYKTMGMAVMLDVIIQYIQSLQNQIEFLSMKLSAANSFCEFNSLEINAMETVVQQGNNVCEGPEMERMTTEEGYGGLSYFHPTWPF